MNDERYTADAIHDRIMAATYDNPGDDIDQSRAAAEVAQDIADHIAAQDARLANAEKAADLWMRKYEDEEMETDRLEDVVAKLEDVVAAAREMRPYISWRDIMYEDASTTTPDEKLARWDAALDALGENKNNPADT